LDDAGCWCGLPEANPNKWAAHLEAVVLAWVGARLAGAREELDDDWERASHDERFAVNDALTAIRDALGVPVAPNSAPVDVDPTATLAAEFDRSNDTEGICDPGCP